jgi:protein-L-isoaspartate(D-aspartate) O-methyltransferase
VQVVSGPLAAGWQPGAPYDVILLNGAIEVAPEALLSQLREGGRLAGVVGRGPAGKSTVFTAAAGRTSARPVFDAAAPVLPGFVANPAFVF